MIKSKTPQGSDNTRPSRRYLVEEMAGEKRFVYWAFGFSCMIHLAVFGAFLVPQKHKPNRILKTSVVNVSLVAAPQKAARSSSAVKKKATVPKTKTSQKKDTYKKTVKVASKPEKKAPVVSTSGKPKVSLKKKTFKASKVKKSALKDIEKKVEKTSSDQITSALDRLKTKVEEQEVEKRLRTEESPAQPSAATGSEGTGQGGRVGELIDIYRVEIAYQIQKNWAFPDQLAGGRSDLQTLLVFKVMPNGEIRDLFFTDRSGNTHFDESAYRAVMKTNPVDPHPAGIIRPYVQMGLRFTPEGVK